MFAIPAAIIGLAFGSFANVLIDRVPAGRSISGRSQCNRCRRTLRWWELIPVASAILLRHRCRTCGVTIPFRLTAVEFGSAALAFAIVARHGALTFDGAVAFIGLLALVVLATIDLRHGVVPDQISLPVIVGIVVAKIFHFSFLTSHFSLVLLSLILPVVAGGGFFVVQRLCSRGRWVGDGDIRVGALMGALLPLPQLLVAFMVTYITGGIIAGVLLATGRAARGTHMPLVPFLALGTVVAVFWGEVILGWYGL